MNDTNDNIITSSPKSEANQPSGKKVNVDRLALGLIFLWIIIPVGFFVVLFAEGMAYGLNHCDSSRDVYFCQPTQTGAYFVAYLVLATALTTLAGALIVRKKKNQAKK